MLKNCSAYVNVDVLSERDTPRMYVIRIRMWKIIMLSCEDSNLLEYRVLCVQMMACCIFSSQSIYYKLSQ